jgi:hypothetical protein
VKKRAFHLKSKHFLYFLALAAARKRGVGDFHGRLTVAMARRIKMNGVFLKKGGKKAEMFPNRGNFC